ncbi:MAG: DNA gyrase subunit A [Nanoarchaeota archaeon]|jgi:DNA gyrase subunit A|nr:DNA gyrase subunit A [Nanoarchaeota archaeon]
MEEYEENQKKEEQATIESSRVEQDPEQVQVAENFGPKFPEEGGVLNSEVVSVMKKSYLDYAMSVIVSRAIPSIEDGQKPVQRRILYAMQQMGLKPSTPTKKSARVVGEVMGKYHPHGDSSIYEAMVRMSQNFSLRYPLVFGQGNFGSIDGDSPAAMRYTEAKLEKVSAELLDDIDKKTVPFGDNYDGSVQEPKLLPGKLPALMLNGATGIAVGMATNIPPHNLGEVADAITAYIENPEITVEELVRTTVRAPDFPTGGIVQGNMVELYKTGRGRTIMRGRVEVEDSKKKTSTKQNLIITEIPYMVNKATLVTQIASLVRDKKIKDISDLRDESSKGLIRVVIELKKDVDPQFVINALYKYTRLQESFSVNFLALVEGKPKILGLRDVLSNYVRHRKVVITNRIKFELKKAQLRQEIVNGLLTALDNIDEVIKIIRYDANPAQKLVERFKFTEVQVKAILETKLRQLTSLENDKLRAEHEELDKKIEEYKNVLGNVNEVLRIIKEEVAELKAKYGDKRRTEITGGGFSEISEKDLVEEKEVIVSITDKGYIKRMDVETYKEQKRGGKGVIGGKLSEGDFTKQLLTCSTHDHLMFFTSRGRVLWLKTYDVPAAERQGKGRAIINLLGLKEEDVTNVISVETFDDYLMMATKSGMVKRIALSHFSKPRSSGVKAINLPEDGSDTLIGVEIVKANEEVSLATSKGKAIRFNSEDVRPMGRSSYGVTGIKMDGDDRVVSLDVLGHDAIFTITEKGYGKRTAIEDYRKTARAGKGVINLKVSEKTGNVVDTVSVKDDDSIIVTTKNGIVIRTGLGSVRVMGRAAQGVRIVNLGEDDSVADIAKVVAEEEVIGETVADDTVEESAD